MTLSGRLLFFLFSLFLFPSLQCQTRQVCHCSLYNRSCNECATTPAGHCLATTQKIQPLLKENYKDFSGVLSLVKIALLPFTTNTPIQ